MAILDFLTKQFIDIIDWTETAGDLAYRYPMQDREIQNGAQLTVREGQLAAFFNEGNVEYESGSITAEDSEILEFAKQSADWECPHCGKMSQVRKTHCDF